MADDPMVEVTYLNSAEVMRVVEKPISDLAGWEFPAASVSAVETQADTRMKQILRLAVIALAPQFVFAAKPISIHAEFEGGALGKIVRIAEAHFRCGVKGASDVEDRDAVIRGSVVARI